MKRIKCSFCNEKTQKIADGWGRAKMSTPTGEIDIVFCPNHRAEAERELDIYFRSQS